MPAGRARARGGPARTVHRGAATDMRRTAVRLAVAGIAYHAVAFAALHVLEPQLSPLRSLIGDYASTPSGWLAASTFVAFAATWAALAIGLSWPTRSRLLPAGRVLFGAAAVALLVAALVPSAADPRTPTALAKALNLARPGLFLGIPLVSIALGRVPEWKGSSRVLVVLALSAFILMLVSVGVLLEAGFAGLGQRIAFLLVYAWVGLVARGALAGGPRGRP